MVFSFWHRTSLISPLAKEIPQTLDLSKELNHELPLSFSLSVYLCLCWCLWMGICCVCRNEHCHKSVFCFTTAQCARVCHRQQWTILWPVEPQHPDCPDIVHVQTVGIVSEVTAKLEQPTLTGQRDHEVAGRRPGKGGQRRIESLFALLSPA